MIELLEVSSETHAAEVDESPLAGEPPAALALRLARAKAEAARTRCAGRLILGADSVVALDGEPLGKPGTPDEARRMLRMLRGRAHQVVTGVALLDADPKRAHLEVVCTTVHMRAYDQQEIEAYVSSGSPLDKAGGYGIQDQPFSPVARIEGCYPNVIGLPLCEVRRGLSQLGLRPEAEESLAAPCHLCRRAAEQFDPSAVPRLFPTDRKS